MGKESACNVRDIGLILGLERSPEEGMATNSSILAWENPRTEELGGLTVHGVARVRHD